MRRVRSKIMVENGSSSRMNRCLIERERRKHMKSLLSKLFALIPPQPTKMSVPELVDQATAYVKNLQMKMEHLKQTKIQLEEENAKRKGKMVSPAVNLTDLGSNLEVNLITGLNMEFALSDFISILQEEGAEITSAICHHLEDKAIYTILSQATYPRIGIATSSVHERLKSLIV